MRTLPPFASWSPMSCVAAIWNFTMLPSPLFLDLSLMLRRLRPSAITFIFSGGRPSHSIISSKSSSSASESVSVKTSSSSSRAAAKASVSKSVSSGIPGNPTATTWSRSISPMPDLPKSFSSLKAGSANISPSDKCTGTLASSSIGDCEAAKDTSRLGCAGTDSRRTTICCSSFLGWVCLLRWYTEADGGSCGILLLLSFFLLACSSSSSSDLSRRIGKVRLRHVTRRPMTSNMSGSEMTSSASPSSLSPSPSFTSS
mmetsp:Transcript_9124/g.22272  ORF Transcript_9124/g.22272 Transcript_9124/m.22272 type:complete len:257 (-) Transcript_9124:1563-2333(-)